MDEPSDERKAEQREHPELRQFAIRRIEVDLDHRGTALISVEGEVGKILVAVDLHQFSGLSRTKDDKVLEHEDVHFRADETPGWALLGVQTIGSPRTLKLVLIRIGVPVLRSTYDGFASVGSRASSTVWSRAE